jgi:RHS repeat-associated protein
MRAKNCGLPHVTDSYEYEAFGNSFTVSGSTPNNFLYRGEQFDPDLGFYYLRARYMNPLTGRFVSRDPEVGRIRDPRTLHKYLYAGGDPVNAMDPTGRDLFESAIITGGSALSATEAGLALVGGTAVGVAEVLSEIAAGAAEISELLAEASLAGGPVMK